MKFSLPTNQQRLAIIGRTGSGKTQFACWALSLAPFHQQPYIIVDYKRDELIGAIDRCTQIALGDIPKTPGLYRVCPLPDQVEEVNNWLWRIWERGRTGLYLDEMYSVPDPRNGSALRAIFTQGRSKRIPVIGLTQRPAWVSKFLFSEADYYAIFHLNTRKDIGAVEEFYPGNAGDRMPKYHCRWYDVGNHALYRIPPVPDAETILQTFDDRLTPKRRSL